MDLLSAKAPLVVAGYASIENVVRLVAERDDARSEGVMRVLFGSEPFVKERPSWSSPTASFTDEAREYWVEEQGISLLMSAKLVQAIGALDSSRLTTRVVPGATRMHAKIYIGDHAATLGSSNFTDPGLRFQFEANARFSRSTEPERYGEVSAAAENYGDIGVSWDPQLRDLLTDLLRFVPWREALARACADLLEGEWAARYLQTVAEETRLWPSQVAGIAEAMWIVESVGSVLVADATGSGKTRMGAHLTRAVRDRLWSTGRVRRDLTVLVCPPSVEEQWKREALACGLGLPTVSHGLLSRGRASGPRVQEEEVAQAQILAIDEAHNFLNTSSNRTAKVRQSSADNVVMFTATPINRGAQDLLALVDLLGADNFDDETLKVLDRLGHRAGDPVLTDVDQARLRAEIQRFTVRRTKSQLNSLVEREQDAYRDAATGRVCRYPKHVMKTYRTGETAEDERSARAIRALAGELKGLQFLGEKIAVPPSLRRDYDDERWRDLRLGAAAGLSKHQVLSAMRSSKVALLEHLVGTQAAAKESGLDSLVKPQKSGDALARMAALRERGLPAVTLNCKLPLWLTDANAWRSACEDELAVLEQILDNARALSLARETSKADRLRRIARRHDRVLAFDRHPITLAVIESLMRGAGMPVTVATGGATAGRRHMTDAFARDSTQRGIGLASDVMNEGINLQGASAVVQLDMPTTLRVAEQRVGRVDRMDSPYDRIEVWWPDDGPAFATRANELLAARNHESSALLGSNLPVPVLGPDDERLVTSTDVIEALGSEQASSDWDGIRDALDPVRQLVDGPRALIARGEYEAHRTTKHRVLSRISPVRSDSPWAFFAVGGTKRGAPRWLLIDAGERPAVGVDEVAERLRVALAEDPPERPFDRDAELVLIDFLQQARLVEVRLLPRRAQRALAQMESSCRHWAASSRRTGDFDLAERWMALSRTARADRIEVSDQLDVDLYQVADAWLHLVQPLREGHRKTHRRRYTTLSDLDSTLLSSPFAIEAVEQALAAVEFVEPIERRISACILGVPTSTHHSDSHTA